VVGAPDRGATTIVFQEVRDSNLHPTWGVEETRRPDWVLQENTDLVDYL
jgi:hypothetical protein